MLYNACYKRAGGSTVVKSMDLFAHKLYIGIHLDVNRQFIDIFGILLFFFPIGNFCKGNTLHTNIEKCYMTKETLVLTYSVSLITKMN